jgi:hypothetical protein
MRDRVAAGDPIWLTSAVPWIILTGDRSMYWFGVLFGAIGAGLILGALTYVSILIGVLVHFMIILMSGPVIDKFLERRKRRSA